jgi:putative sterol carrier protein
MLEDVQGRRRDRKEAARLVSRIQVCAREDQSLNGLGMMLQQYLEQNLAEFEGKRKAAQGLRGCVSVEVEKGIATTVSFQGDRILIENGVGPNPDLHLKASYLVLSQVLTGKASPFGEVLRGNIKLCVFPRRPIQCMKTLRFLRVPSEVLLEPLPGKGSIYFLWVVGSLVGVGGLSLLVYYVLQLFGGQ